MFKRFFNWLFGRKSEEKKPAISWTTIPVQTAPPVVTTTVPVPATEPVIVTTTTPTPIPTQPVSTSTPIPVATPAISVPVATPATTTPTQETMIMGDYEYIKNAQGQWEIKVDPVRHPVKHPEPPKDSGIGKTRLPNGAIYQGNGRYGLPSDSQFRVANRALGEAKYGRDTKILNTILSRIVEPYSFDSEKFPLLKQMVDVYIANGNNYPAGAIDLSNVEYVPAPGTPDVRLGAVVAPEYGNITGDMYRGNAMYTPVEVIDEEKYKRYLTEICNKINPKTGRVWFYTEIAEYLGVSNQMAFDMIARAQVEYNNGYLPTTVVK